MQPLDISSLVPFSGATFDRCDAQRADGRWLADQLDDPNARFIALHDLKPAMLTLPTLSLARLRRSEIPVAFENETTILFIGHEDGAPLFGVELFEPEALHLQEVGYTFIEVRAISMQMHGPDLALIGHTRSMLSWHTRNRFCGQCGTRTLLRKGGTSRECGNDACGVEFFPRNDPVVIMLATRGDQCLLGRQHRFPPRLYSALAGFLEHGESLEEAVRRELFEESGIRAGKVEYIASQPWPFEQSIMIGCLAEALNDDINMDAEELSDCRWVERGICAAALSGSPASPIMLPPDMAIAHHLIKHWVER